MASMDSKLKVEKLEKRNSPVIVGPAPSDTQKGKGGSN